MSLKVYNTFTREKEEFVPLHGNNVGMYVCGPTVYGYPHLGHAKSYISFDTVYRYLKFKGYNVKYVQNITDVGHLVKDADEGESKIEKQAKLEQLDPYQIAYKYELAYFNDMEKLNILKPDISCRATGHIIEIIDMIKTLVDKGYAYVTENNNVYYDVSKFKEYGKLSNRNLDDTVSGERINVADDKKRPEDFALWKSADETHLMHWPSPWGEGYPGWHIECSVMSKKYLGETFDIHGGGVDNMFPHHECEIAQSEAANEVPFVKYFMHNNLVTVNGQKMGKSLGNSMFLDDIFKMYNPLVIRFYTLLSHYRRPTDFDDAKINEAKENYESIVRAVSKLSNLDKEYNEDKEITEIKDKFLDAMDDDFNTSLAISYVYELVKIINTTNDENKLKNIKSVFEIVIEPVLGLSFKKSNNSDNKEDELIKYIIELRNNARSEKRFDISDNIRDSLLKMGITLKDSREGTTYEK
ncbi:MAG: cysteine--tRNA ligase [Bacilli bacterium]|nr:cysteine--tRNA ligase [Bacilli bacterium]